MQSGETWEEHQRQQFEAVGLASVQIRLLGDAWYRIKTLPEWNQRLSGSNKQHFVLSALAARQIRLLIAVDACSVAGCDQSALILCRSMFESFLCSIALSYAKDASETDRLVNMLVDHHNHLISDTLKSAPYVDALGRIGVSKGEIEGVVEKFSSVRNPNKRDNN